MKNYWHNSFLLVFSLLLLGQQATLIPSSYAVESQTVEQTKMKDATEFINSLVKTASDLSSYTTSFEMTLYKNKSVIKETGYISFKKPRLIRTEVISGPKKGSVAVLAKDGNIHGHLGGFLKFVVKTLPPDSDEASAINGHLMKDSDFLSLALYLKNALKTGDSSSVSADPVLASGLNQKVYILELTRKTNNKVELVKRVLVSPQTNLPISWEDYRNGSLYSVNRWSNLKTNVDLKDQLFQL